ncbi:adenylate cyclase [Breoghania corrubedonensis]|uniref:Adenylate cyclase n=1 Tax=Breoghania corrubedonensis TaxID=665038 RepID=A0A2T5V1I2_9HYPH|nr:adenylate/guanylate cyclase domain-containing protein [Breoghania corrubedonensis]PTW57615.1 adenylate cyclase [Breoghania corrubedonensis]
MNWWRLRRGRRKKPSIILIAGGSYALLVGIAMAIVLALTGRANYENTLALLNDKAVLTTNTLERGLRGRLDPVTAAVGALQKLYGESDVELSDRGVLMTALAASLASVPAAEGLVINVPDRGEFGMLKQSDGTLRPLRLQTSRNHIRGPYQEPQFDAGSGPIWGPMVVNDHGVYANVSAPLVRDGKIMAILIATISTNALSEMVEELDTSLGTTFILSDTGRVIAYSDLDELKNEAPEQRSLPRPLGHFGDPVLRVLFQTPTMAPFDAARKAGVDVREIDTADGEYIAMSRRISGYGPVGWVVGVYFLNSTVSGEIRRLIGSSLVGVAATVLAIYLSFRIARRLTRPLSSLVDQSRKVAALQFDKVDLLPESPVHEIDQVMQAFNSMAAGLRALNTYVPKTLFRKLMRLGLEEAARSREVEITILFTDIAGFTRQSEGMSAGEAAAFLNRHFAMLVGAVEAENGTVDKFMGDGMLAFWGAPDERSDHAEAAVRSVGVIKAALQAANREEEDCAHRTRLRIGIHTGPVIVGNIGAFDRVDYTIVGDAVNVCQRLQELGRSVGENDEVVILASDSTVERLAPSVPRLHSGRHRLRGREAEVDVWRLFPETDATNVSGDKA